MSDPKEESPDQTAGSEEEPLSTSDKTNSAEKPPLMKEDEDGFVSYYHIAQYFYGFASRMPTIMGPVAGFHAGGKSLGCAVAFLVATSLGRGATSSIHGQWQKQMLGSEKTFTTLALVLGSLAYLALISLPKTDSDSTLVPHILCFFILGSAELNGPIDFLITQDITKAVAKDASPSRRLQRASWLSNMILELGTGSCLFVGSWAYTNEVFGSSLQSLAVVGLCCHFGFIVTILLSPASRPSPNVNSVKSQASKADKVATAEAMFLGLGMLFSSLLVSTIFAYGPMLYANLELSAYDYAADFARGALVGVVFRLILFAPDPHARNALSQYILGSSSSSDVSEESSPDDSSNAHWVFVRATFIHAVFFLLLCLGSASHNSMMTRLGVIMVIGFNLNCHGVLHQILSSKPGVIPHSVAYLIRRLSNSFFAVVIWLVHYVAGVYHQAVPLVAVLAVMSIWAIIAAYLVSVIKDSSKTA